MQTCKNNENCILNDVSNNYEKRLIKTISPVIKGIKSSEIISLPKNEENIESKLELLTNLYNRCYKIEGKVIPYSNNSIKVFIYNKSSLEKILHKKNIKKFLASYGYSMECTTEDYLNILYKKISRGSIPSEIGIFLGYPLKDVMGFMGINNLPLTKVNYWRIYGNADISDKLFNNIQKVKLSTEKLLTYKTPQQVLELLLN